MESKGRRLRWLFLPAPLALPFAAAAAYIIATREWVVIDAAWDWLGGALCLTFGLACLWQLPASRMAGRW